MKVPAAYYDEVFQFSGEWDVPSACGLKIIPAGEGGASGRFGGKPVVIVTELYQDNPGTSVTGAGRHLADQVCAAKGLRLEDIVYIECAPDTNSKLSFYDEELFVVDFFAPNGTTYRRLPQDKARRLLS